MSLTLVFAGICRSLGWARRALIAITILSLGIACAAAQAESPGGDFASQFKAAIGASLAGDYPAAITDAAEALKLAEGDLQRYRAHHLLVDAYGRLGDWPAAEQHAQRAAATIKDSEQLSATLMVMASHMAAEAARAASYQGAADRVAVANRHMVADHPDAGSHWRAVGEQGAVHRSGAACPLLVEHYLRFDLYDQQGVPGCEYWAHSDIGARIFWGDVTAQEVQRLKERRVPATETMINAEVAQELIVQSQWHIRDGVSAVILTAGSVPMTLVIQYPEAANRELAAASNHFAELLRREAM